MDSLVVNFNNISANDKARDIYNLAYVDTPENRLNFEKELLAMKEKDDYLLLAAMRSQYIAVFRISTTIKPNDWAKRLLIQHKIIEEFE
jgi:hypothetical protein